MVGRAHRGSLCTAPAARGFIRVSACLNGSEVASKNARYERGSESVCGERPLATAEPHRMLPPAQSQRQHQRRCDTLHYSEEG